MRLLLAGQLFFSQFFSINPGVELHDNKVSQAVNNSTETGKITNTPVPIDVSVNNKLSHDVAPIEEDDEHNYEAVDGEFHVLDGFFTEQGHLFLVWTGEGWSHGGLGLTLTFTHGCSRSEDKRWKHLVNFSPFGVVFFMRGISL